MKISKIFKLISLLNLVFTILLIFPLNLYSQATEVELLVRTINTKSQDDYNPKRLKGIAETFYADYPSQIGLIGMQEAKGDMTGCRISSSLNNSAKCFAGELANLFNTEAEGRHTGGNMDIENGIVAGGNWTIISSKSWGIHSTCLGFGAKHRKLIEVLVEHKRLGYRLRFYSVHFTPGADEKEEREYQAEKVVKIIRERAKRGELPPILVGDFNCKPCSYNSQTGEAEKSIRILGKHFWRPIDEYPSTSVIIDIIYIGKAESFPYSTGSYETIEHRRVKFKNNPYLVEGQLFDQLTDHDSEGFRLKIKYTSLPYIIWWEDKDFKGTRHKRILHPADYGKCLDLVHNDKMKSIKFYGLPGWKLYIFDNGSCRKNDDWGMITFPNDPSIDVVEVPKIGRQGPSSCTPPGTYEFHSHNGLPGKVSAIKFFYEGCMLGYNYEGIQGYIFPSQIPGTVPLYMMYNFHAGDHFYTISSGGTSPIGDWQPRGIIGYVYSESGQNDRSPLYRWYKPRPNRPKKTDHFYTTSSSEPTSGSGYLYEGIECYVPKSNISGSVPFYRWYKGSINDHFYTRSTSEPTAGSGYVYEGIQCNIFPNQSSGTVPFYRLYSNKARDHFYTISSEGANSIGSWHPEGIAGWVYSGPAPSNRQPLYRWYKPSPHKPIKTDHFYTTSTTEPTSNSGYHFEGIECYLPVEGSAGTVLLYRYYNPTLNDHCYTTTPPSSY